MTFEAKKIDFLLVNAYLPAVKCFVLVILNTTCISVASDMQQTELGVILLFLCNHFLQKCNTERVLIDIYTIVFETLLMLLISIYYNLQENLFWNNIIFAIWCCSGIIAKFLTNNMKRDTNPVLLNTSMIVVFVFTAIIMSTSSIQQKSSFLLPFIMIKSLVYTTSVIAHAYSWCIFSFHSVEPKRFFDWEKTQLFFHGSIFLATTWQVILIASLLQLASQALLTFSQSHVHAKKNEDIEQNKNTAQVEKKEWHPQKDSLDSKKTLFKIKTPVDTAAKQMELPILPENKFKELNKDMEQIEVSIDEFEKCLRQHQEYSEN